MSEKASTVVEENNRLRNATNIYNNTVVVQLNNLLTNYNLVEPITIEQLETLTLKQLGAILRDIAPSIEYIGLEIADRKFESNLSDAGYATPSDAVIDIPNVLSGDSAAYAEITFNHTINTLSVLDALVDADLMLILLGKIIDIKNAISNTASDMTEI